MDLKLAVRIDDGTFSVTEVPVFASIPGIVNHGQRYQLPGHVLALVNVRVSEIILVHPDAKPICGTFDVQVYFDSTSVHFYDVRGTVSRQLHLNDVTTLSGVWPTQDGYAAAHLVRVIDAIERYSQKRFAIVPRLLQLMVLALVERQRYEREFEQKIDEDENV